jgi:hypothetical protein
MFLLLLHQIFHGEAFTVAEIVEKLNGKTSTSGSHAATSEPTAQAAALKAALPGYLAAIDRDGPLRMKAGRAFAVKADRRFGRSGVHLRKGGLLTGRQQWQVVRCAPSGGLAQPQVGLLVG